MEPVVLEKLELQAVRGIPELVMEFNAPEPGEGQWIVLLGENGAGKTTILSSLAALCGAWKLTGIRGLGRHGASMDTLLRLEVRDEPRRAAFHHRGTMVWSGSQEGYPLATPEGPSQRLGFDLLGYGSRRGGALGGPERDVHFGDQGPSAVFRHAISLFDPNARLIHAETWLRNREHAALKSGGGRDQAFFESVVDTVLALLPGIEHLEVGSDEVTVRGPAVGECALAELADGYLTTLGWTLDFIARWAHFHQDQVDGDFRHRMRALVLVDEIDLHLHPRWQRTILEEIRATFPVTSFVVTTHNPLTIQGARPGEVHVLSRDAQGNVSSRQVDPPLGADVDDLLTGPWFGLPTTYDADTLDKLEDHAALLRKGVPRSDPRRQALEAILRQRLSGFADTEADRELLQRGADEGLEGLADKMSRFLATRK